MQYLETIVFVVGVALLVTGYRKNHRNVMACAAVVMFSSAVMGDFVLGWNAGGKPSIPAAAAQ